MFNYYQLVLKIRTPMISSLALTGVILLFFFILQVLWGFLLALSYIPEIMLVSFVRNIEDQENYISDNIFKCHERGVEFIFIFLFAHIFRKIYLKSFCRGQVSAWKTGSVLLYITHLIIFFGIMLTGTHLSDVTLKIASNIASALLLNLFDYTYFIFTDKRLNTDTLQRSMLLHYIAPFISLFIVFIHLVFMHYNYRVDNLPRTNRILFSWFGFIFRLEFIFFVLIVFYVYSCSSFIYSNTESLSYEIFMWGEVGLNNDVRFYGVAPHWYFKCYMSWLITCPDFYIGIFGLVYFFYSFYALPLVFYRNLIFYNYFLLESRVFSSVSFFIFLFSCFYAGSYLPYGKFFTSLGGNTSTLVAFFIVIIYVSVPIDKKFRLVVDRVALRDL